VFASETTKFDASKVDAVIELMLQIGFLWQVDVKTDRGMQTKLVFTQTGVARSFALLAMQAVINNSVANESIGSGGCRYIWQYFETLWIGINYVVRQFCNLIGKIRL